MMADLISRAEAVARIDKCVALSGIGLEPVMAVRDVKALISALPAVDAAPVVHGMWIYFNCVGNGRYQCSECFHWVDAGTDRNYCPNCGAKMDGERRDDDGSAD